MLSAAKSDLPVARFDPEFPISNLPPGNNIRSGPPDEEFLRNLADSMRTKGQLQPIGLTPSRMLWGFMRVAAAKLAGMTTIKAMVYPEVTEQQAVILMAIENLQRSEMSDIDVFLTCETLEKSGLARNAIAEAIHKSPGQVTRNLSPNAGPSEAKEAFLAGRLKLDQCASIATAKDPIGMMRRFLSGATRAQAKQEDAKAAKQRDGKPDESATDKLDGLQIALLDGAITVKAKDMTLAKAVELLDAAHGAAEQGRNDGLAIKTFQNLMRDRARKAIADRKAKEKKRAAEEQKKQAAESLAEAG